MTSIIGTLEGIYVWHQRVDRCEGNKARLNTVEKTGQNNSHHG